MVRLAACLLPLLFLSCSPGSQGTVIDAPPGTDEGAVLTMTGHGVDAFDDAMPSFLQRSNIPGAAVAVSVGERLVVARGYGLRDRAAALPVQPDTRFRIASLSKPLTATAVLQLVSEGTISLSDPAFGHLSDLQPAGGAVADDRIAAVTIEDLLYHFGGWDRNRSFDPMFIPVLAAQTLQVPPPADAETVIRYMLGQRLDHAPGSTYAYSNFGYAVLGRVIERLTGQSYEDAIAERVLLPAGISEMRIGRSLVSTSGETRYYDYPGAPQAASVFDPASENRVNRPYGGFHLEAMDSHGGWTASAVDLVRFLTAVDGADLRPDLITASTREAMLSHPGKHWGTGYFYAMGWERPGLEFSHTGALPGTSSYMGCRGSVCIAAVFNSWPQTDSGYFGDMTSTLWAAAVATEVWPEGNLFETW